MMALLILLSKGVNISMSSSQKIRPVHHTQPFKSQRPPSCGNRDHKRNTQLSHGWKTKSKLWLESSSSMTRDRAPSHKIPTAHRFHTESAYSHSRKSSSHIEYNNSAIEMARRGQGISFAKAVRPEHFVKKSSCSDVGWTEPNEERSLNACTKMKRRMRSQPIEAISTNTIESRERKKGGTIGKSSSKDKEYLIHSRNRPYVTENGTPGPGMYNLSWANKRQQIRYTFRATLETYKKRKSTGPGPSAYMPHESPLKNPSSNVRGTLAQSKRNFLTKFPNGPAPNQYQIDDYLKNNE